MPRTLPDKLLLAYLLLYACVAGYASSFLPSYSWPGGDEATYYTYAQRPWTLQSDLFEGFPPKEMISPYNLRAFLAPFSLVFELFGFTVWGARLTVVACGVLLLLVSYLLARRLAGPWLACGFTVLLSMSPMFIVQTHVVRPETMFSLGLMLWLWLLVRRDEPLSPRYAAGLGFLAASLLWVHYNAVVFWPILLLVLIWHEGRRLPLKSYGAFVAGGAAFGVVFFVLNFVPARDTIQKLGPLPQTFVSSNKMPILTGEMGRSTEKLNKLLYQWTRGELQNEVWLDFGAARLNTSWVTLTIAAIPLLGMWRERRKAWWAIALFVLLTMLAQWLFVPNARDDNFIYILPAIFVLAAGTIGRLQGTPREVATLVTLVAGISLYGFADFLIFDTWRKVDQGNQATIQTLANLVDRLGPRDKLLVMGPQEFHAATYGVRYRTFHSVIQSKSFQETLQTARPDVVIMTPRIRELIPRFITEERAYLPPDELQRKIDRLYEQEIFIVWEGRFAIDYLKLQRMVPESLLAEGYQLVASPMYWDGQPDTVEVWVRGDQLERLKAQLQQEQNAAPARP